MTRLVFFFICTLLFLWFSRRSLTNPNSHGFYRFFVFEGILVIVLLNHPYWFDNPFSPLHLLSWFLLLSSIVFVGYSLLLLRRLGGHANREEMPENLKFENTARIVDEGIYRVIRHPMYTSLLFLGWGAFLKHTTPLTALIITLVSILLIIVAKVEERENVAFFGNAYRDYIKRTWMFVPWLL